MIAHLRGTLIHKTSTELIIECAGVGYLVNVSITSSGDMPEIGEETSIHTLLIPREDSLNLFGFSTIAERELFKLLTSVTGIGPKTALGILSSINVEELRIAVLESNLKVLQKLPGIGKKTAERVVVELKDKVIKIHGVETIIANDASYLVKQEALSALLTLGYNKAEAEKAVKKASNELQFNCTAEELIRLSLKMIME